MPIQAAQFQALAVQIETVAFELGLPESEAVGISVGERPGRQFHADLIELGLIDIPKFDVAQAVDGKFVDIRRGQRGREAAGPDRFSLRVAQGQQKLALARKRRLAL